MTKDDSTPMMRGLPGPEIKTRTAIAIAAALALVTTIAMAHPHPLALPLVSSAFVVVGLVAALAAAILAYSRKLPAASRLGVPGLVVMFGFAAALLGEAEPVLEYLQSRR